MAGKKNKSKTEKPPAIDKLLMPAVGVVLAFVAYYFMKGINTDVSAALPLQLYNLQMVHCHIRTLLMLYVDPKSRCGRRTSSP
jgi:hypothetical protein